MTIKVKDAVTMVNHPQQFKEGTRLIMRVWRNKEVAKEDADGSSRLGRTLISHCPEEWDEDVEHLALTMVLGQRIYASAEARDVERAIRLFKERQLAADYDAPDVRGAFYDKCYERWLSCLGAPQASDETYFLFDCDDDAMILAAEAEIAMVAAAVPVHRYATKNGRHILTKPFNPALLTPEVRGVLQRNPMLLVAWV